MTSCQSRSLVDEEELRVVTRGHDRTLSALELKQADDPALAHERAPNLSVVQTPAIAGQRAAGGGDYQCAKGGDAILSWHGEEDLRTGPGRRDALCLPAGNARGQLIIPQFSANGLKLGPSPAPFQVRELLLKRNIVPKRRQPTIKEGLFLAGCKCA